MKYKINGKEIELTEPLDVFSSKSSVIDILAKVIVKQNELIQALGEPVEEKPAIKAPFYSKFTGNCLGYRDITVTLGEDETWEEPKKWDRRELEEGSTYWYVDAYGFVCWTNNQSLCSNLINFNNWNIKSGNCFETKEEAENYKRKILGE